MKIRIDPEFSSLIPAVPAEHDGELEAEVLADERFTEPLIVWKHQNTLLDGHRRYRIACKHPHLKAPVPVLLDFQSRQEAHDWIIRHQLAKRNVNESQRKYLLGKLWSKNGRSPGNPAFSPQKPNSANLAELASEHGVSERTVENAAAFAEAVDAVAETAPEVKDAVLSGEVKATTKDLEALAELTEKQQAKATAAIESGKAKSVGAAVKAAKPARGQPKVDARKFSELESQIGKAVRANTAIKEHCGGDSFHEKIRQHLNEALKVLAQWRKQMI